MQLSLVIKESSYFVLHEFFFFFMYFLKSELERKTDSYMTVCIREQQ